MSDTKEIADDVLQRVDKLTEKLGLAANKVWDFSVKAKVVNAKKGIIIAILWLFLPIFLLFLSHSLFQVRPSPSDNVNCATFFAYVFLVVAAIATGICISAAIESWAATKTAEHDAYQDIIRDLRRG